MILSHLQQRPTAALLSHAGVDGVCSPGKEGDRALDRVVTLLGGSVSHCLPRGTGCVKLQTLSGFLSWRGLMEVCSGF